jgi:hypothetical protein
MSPKESQPRKDTESAPIGSGTARPLFAVELLAKPAHPVGGHSSKLTFSVFDLEGNRVTEFQKLYGRHLNLSAFSFDLKDFQHVQADAGREGRLSVSTHFPRSTSYVLFAEFQPEGTARPRTVRAELLPDPQSATQPGLSLSAEHRSSVEVGFSRRLGDTRVQLNGGVVELLAARPELLTFTLTDARVGGPMTNLRDCMGAMGHAFVISEDKRTFLHSRGEASGAEVRVSLTFPRPGLYKLFAQFNAAGQLRVAEYTVRVR